MSDSASSSDDSVLEALPRHGLVCVVGARPNFMKIAPIWRALSEQLDMPLSLVHTGQHYDASMKETFFRQLEIPEPDVDLGVGSGSHAQQTAEIMLRFEPIIAHCQPRAILVVGDVNSTVACALVAAKLQTPVIHVEAGLRSRDRSMPEEINRLLTDQLSDLLFTTERHAEDNLTAEGIEATKICFVGNVMIDNLKRQQPKAIAFQDTLQHYGREAVSARCREAGYATLTLHRPANVDAPAVLEELLGTLRQVSERLPILFPVHPRTQAALQRAGQWQALDQDPGIITLPALGYFQMLGLLQSARLVLTDSGGIQEETTALGVPCLTLRDNTERPITIDAGTNTLVRRDRAHILACVDDILRTGGKRGRIPEYWDGSAAVRIAARIQTWLGDTTYG